MTQTSSSTLNYIEENINMKLVFFIRFGMAHPTRFRVNSLKIINFSRFLFYFLFSMRNPLIDVWV